VLRVVAVTLLWLSLATVSAAQIPIPAPRAPAPSSSLPVASVGRLDTGPVVYEGRTLFTVAAPAQTDQKSTRPIFQRLDAIAENLRRIVPIVDGPGRIKIGDSRFEASSFRVAIGSENGYPTLYATDGRSGDVVPILTVTEADEALNGLPRNEIATRWQDTLQDAIAPVVRASEPDYLRRQLRRLPFFGIGAVVISLLLGFGQYWLQKRCKVLEHATSGTDAPATSNAPEARRLRQRLAAVSAGSWLLGGCLLLVWLLFVLWTLQIFPTTRAYAYDIAVRSVKIVILWFVVFVVDRGMSLLIERASENWAYNPFLSSEGRARMALRRPTIAHAVENLKLIVLVAVGIGWTFSILQISTTSALTIGAIGGFAVSFAAQSTVKDYVNGFYFLTEDQLAIGDRVTINGKTGKVANITLRITQIRTDDGSLVTLANNAINMVENVTRG
jgi:small conductance mechanosensitive channel